MEPRGVRKSVDFLTDIYKTRVHWSIASPYMIMCMYGSCVASYEQEMVRAVVRCKLLCDCGFANVIGNFGNPSGSVGVPHVARTTSIT